MGPRGAAAGRGGFCFFEVQEDFLVLLACQCSSLLRRVLLVLLISDIDQQIIHAGLIDTRQLA